MPPPMLAVPKLAMPPPLTCSLSSWCCPSRVTLWPLPSRVRLVAMVKVAVRGIVPLQPKVMVSPLAALLMALRSWVSSVQPVMLTAHAQQQAERDQARPGRETEGEPHP